MVVTAPSKRRVRLWVDPPKKRSIGNLFHPANVNIGKVGTAVLRCIFSVKVTKSAMGPGEKIGKTLGFQRKWSVSRLVKGVAGGSLFWQSLRISLPLMDPGHCAGWDNSSGWRDDNACTEKPCYRDRSWSTFPIHPAFPIPPTPRCGGADPTYRDRSPR